MVKVDYLKEFTAKLQSLDRSKRIYEVFKDFLTLSTCALAQACLVVGDKRARISRADDFSPLPTIRFYRSDEIEQIYLETVNKYTKEQAEEFLQLLAFLIGALTEKHQDFLGQVYMHLNLGNSAKGQFFTPYHVSQLMAEINFAEVEEKLKSNEFITLSDPCCGSAGMIIAFAETMKNKGYNYQNQLFVEVIDIDEVCFMMAYIQLSLYGIPAKLMLGDSLAWKFSKVLYTPFYFVNGVENKIKTFSEKHSNFVRIETKQISLF